MATNRKAEVDAAAKNLDFGKHKYQLVLDTNQGKITLDMLPEVALVKLMWVLANNPEEVGSLMKTPLAGEISHSIPITV